MNKNPDSQTFNIVLKLILVIAISNCFVNFLPGIAFPCCVSVNNCICHFSPLASDADVVLKDHDMVLSFIYQVGKLDCFELADLMLLNHNLEVA